MDDELMKHKHHIIPKHMGGTDDSFNLVELTVKEHAEAHRILFETYGRKEDELAWKGLAGIIGKEELLHELFVMSGKKSKPPIGHKANLGRKWSDEYKQKMSFVTKGIKKTQEHKNKISEGNSKKWLITKPDGEELEIKNLQKYCKENNLNASKMCSVASGLRKHHKNHTCLKLG
jgi:hypothetical protein